MAEAGGADRQFFRYPAVSNGAHRSFFYFSEEGLPAPIFLRKGRFPGVRPGETAKKVACPGKRRLGRGRAGNRADGLFEKEIYRQGGKIKRKVCFYGEIL